MLVLVTGAQGQLGSLAARDLRADHDVVALSRAELDLTDAAAVSAVVATVRPDVVWNASAYNDVDGAEENALGALRVNAFAVQTLARAAASVGAALVHYSSDFVFDGETDRPYTEEDAPNPKSVYGASKLLGELFAQRAPRHYVLRLESVFGGPPRSSTLGKIVETLRAGRVARVFTDRIVTPSYAPDVIAATRGLLAAGAPSGVYHVVNSGAASWHDVAKEAARLLGKAGLLEPVSVNDVKLRAPRPMFCALSNAKLAGLGITMPGWQDALRRFLS